TSEQTGRSFRNRLELPDSTLYRIGPAGRLPFRRSGGFQADVDLFKCDPPEVRKQPADVIQSDSAREVVPVLAPEPPFNDAVSHARYESWRFRNVTRHVALVTMENVSPSAQGRTPLENTMKQDLRALIRYAENADVGI